MEPCDVEHAVWAEQSEAIFDDEDDCFESAKLHLEEKWDDNPLLKELGAHKTVLICTELTSPA